MQAKILSMLMWTERQTGTDETCPHPDERYQHLINCTTPGEIWKQLPPKSAASLSPQPICHCTRTHTCAHAHTHTLMKKHQAHPNGGSFHKTGYALKKCLMMKDRERLKNGFQIKREHRDKKLNARRNPAGDSGPEGRGGNANEVCELDSNDVTGPPS